MIKCSHRSPTYRGGFSITGPRAIGCKSRTNGRSMMNNGNSQCYKANLLYGQLFWLWYCQDIAAPVAGVIRRTCIRSAPRAVEWEELATGVQWKVSRPSGLKRA